MNLTDVDLCNEFEFIEPLYNADGVRVTAANSITMTPMFFVSAKCSNPEAAIRLADAMLVDPFANDMLIYFALSKHNHGRHCSVLCIGNIQFYSSTQQRSLLIVGVRRYGRSHAALKNAG